MMRFLKIFTSLFMTICPVFVFSLTVTEFFYDSDAWLRSEDRFLELYNDGQETIDLSRLEIELPRDSSTVRMGFKLFGSFNLGYSDPKTNSFLLNPRQYAIVCADDQAEGNALIFFDSNALLVGVSDQAGFKHSWSGHLKSVRIWDGSVLLYSASDKIFEPSKNGESLHLFGKHYVSRPISAGWESQDFLSASRRVLRGKEEALVRFETKEASQKPFFYLRSESLATGSIRWFHLIPISNQVFIAWVSFDGEGHGSDLILECQDQRFLLRHLEERPLATNFQAVLINEVVAEALKDYSGDSGSGWDGQDHGGKINDTDDWIELVNRGSKEIDLSHFYILQETRSSESVKALVFRTGSAILSPSNYLVVSASGGFSKNARLRLYDAHPYRKGRIVDEVTYGNFEDEDGVWNNAPGSDEPTPQNEALARIPNARFGTNDKQIFERSAASFASMNGADRPRIWACFSNRSMQVFVTDPEQIHSLLTVSIRGQKDFETLKLTNRYLFYGGKILISESDGMEENGILEVQNGETLEVSYDDEIQENTASFYLDWASKGWKVSEEKGDLDSVVIFPNPIRRGEMLRLANLPEDVLVHITDSSGRVLGRLEAPRNGKLEWRVPEWGGLAYVLILFRQGERLCVKKLWLH